MENTIEQWSWKKVLEKYSSYEGSLSDFCSENNITKHQLYYYKKKLEKSNKPAFHAIAIKPIKVPEDAEKQFKDIRIEIGNANIFIPSNETALLKTILKELTAIC